MNREAAKDLFRKDKDSYGNPKAIMSKIDLIYNEFEKEARIKNIITDIELTNLTEIYKTNRPIVAQICDEVLDRSGELLGRIREIYNRK